MAKDTQIPTIDALRKTYAESDAFVQAAMDSGDTRVAGNLLKANQSGSDDQPSAPAAPMLSTYEEARRNTVIAQAEGSARDKNAPIVPITGILHDENGYPKRIMVMEHPQLAEMGELPAGASAKKIEEESRKFFKASGLVDDKLFDKYMAGDGDARKALQKVLTAQTGDANIWGRQTLAQLEQNREQYAAAAAPKQAAAVTATAKAQPTKPKM